MKVLKRVRGKLALVFILCILLVGSVVGIVAASDVSTGKYDVFTEHFVMNNGYNEAYFQMEKADAMLHNFFTGSLRDRSEKAYCMMYPMNFEQVEAREDEFDVLRADINKKLKQAGIRDSQINYTVQNKYKNAMASGNGTDIQTTNVGELALPGKLTNNGKPLTYERKIEVTDYMEYAKTGDVIYEFKAVVANATTSDVNIRVSSSENSRQTLNSKSVKRGATEEVKIKGTLNAENVLNESGKYYIYLQITSSQNGKVEVSEATFNLKRQTEKVLKSVYVTSTPVPESYEDTYAKATGSKPRETQTYTRGDDMYVVMQFSVPVQLKRMMFSDSSFENAVYKKYHVKAYYNGYPRLALGITTDGTEQNTKESIYADYFGTMDGVDEYGKPIEHSCLIFKVDIGDKEQGTFTIAGLSNQVSKYNRSGNMEWLYPLDNNSSSEVAFLNEAKAYISEYYPKYTFKSDEDYFKGAVVDADAYKIKVTNRSTPLTGEVLPTYSGAAPVIEKVSISNNDLKGSQYLTAGDSIKVAVTYSTKLDTSIPAPTMYLNDNTRNTDKMPGDENWDGTVLDNGVYAGTKIEPLLANLKAESPAVDGVATLSITGEKIDTEESEIYYRVVEELGVALQAGAEFDTTGWTKYEKPVKLTGLPNIVYENKKQEDGTTYVDIIKYGGFIEICQITKANNTKLVEKFGSSDAINTYEDSQEKAITQNNTTEKTTITYVKKVKNASAVKNYYVLPDLPSYKWNLAGQDYRYDGVTTLRVDGVVKGVTGQEMPATNNFGTIDEKGIFVETGYQTSNVKSEIIPPIVGSNTTGQKGNRTLEFRMRENEWSYNESESAAANGQLYLPATGLKEYSLQVGPIKAACIVTVDGKEYELEKNETRTITGVMEASELYYKEVKISAKLVLDGTVSVNDCLLPIVATIWDNAKNKTKVSETYELSSTYADLTVAGMITKEAVVMDHTADADLERDAQYNVRIDVTDATDDFDLKYVKFAILDANEQPDENTVWTNFSNEDQKITIAQTDKLIDQPGITGEINQNKDELINVDVDAIMSFNKILGLKITIPRRGAYLHKRCYITYKTPEGNIFQKVAIDTEGSEEHVIYNWTSCEFTYDTTQNPSPIDDQKTQTEKIIQTEYSSNPLDGAKITLVDGQMINGKLIRKDNYQYRVVTDEYTSVQCSVSTTWNDNRSKTVMIPSNSDVIINTRELGAVHNSKLPFGGSSWKVNYRVSFIPIVKKKVTTIERTYIYDTDGNLTTTDSEPVITYTDGEIIQQNVKEYSILPLDENVLTRTEAVETEDPGHVRSLNLEIDREWNEINGYYYIGSAMSRTIPYTNRAEDFSNVTMAYNYRIKDVLKPETDIDFDNSWIYIYPLEVENPDEIVACYKPENVDYVRKIPLPREYGEITYDVYGSKRTALGFKADLNAYLTTTDEDGNEMYTIPESGLYGAFVEIATYADDANGNRIILTSENYDYETESNRQFADVIFGYDNEAPEAYLYWQEEVEEYCKTVTEEGSSYVDQLLYNEAEFVKENNSQSYAVAARGETKSVIVMNPTGEFGGYETTDDKYIIIGNQQREWSEERVCKIQYALVPESQVDKNGNIRPECMDEITWQDSVRYGITVQRRIDITVPEDASENYYLFVTGMDVATNEINMMSKKIIVDTSGPEANVYPSTKQSTINPVTLSLIQVTDNYTSANEIKVVQEDGTKVDAVGYKISVDKNGVYQFILEDKVGNQSTISYEVTNIGIGGPDVNISQAETSLIESAKKSVDLDTLDKNLKLLAEATNLPELSYSDTVESGTAYIQFKVKPLIGETITMDYGFTADSYNKLYGLTGEDATSENLWNAGNQSEGLYAFSMVNTSISKEVDEDGYYTVSAAVRLPGVKEDMNCIINFRFGDKDGMYTYYSIGYQLHAGGELSASFKAQEDLSNKQIVEFTEPVRILSPVYQDSTQYFSKMAKVSCDSNGNYVFLVEDLFGNQQELSVTYADYPEYIPDAESTTQDGQVTVEFDMGYTSGYAMRFEQEAVNATVTTATSESGRIIEINGEPAYQYAVATFTGNGSIPITLVSEDGTRTETYTYYVNSFVETEHTCDITYSRNIEDNTSDNKKDAVIAMLNIPEDAKTLNYDGTSHIFYKNGSYTFRVQYADGYIEEAIATVGWIEESEKEGTDTEGPIYDSSRFAYDNEEVIPLDSDEQGNYPETNAKVLVKILPLDMNPIEGGLNYVTMEVSSENGKAIQDENDEYYIVFTENDIAHVTLADPSGNKTMFDITVDNIVPESKLESSLRYVRYGLTKMRAYIELGEGVTLADYEGIQEEKKSDGTIQYYHQFTQSGIFTFHLKGKNGNMADVTTKEVIVQREPLILTENSRTPEIPEWGQPQTVNVDSNLELSEVYFTDTSEGIVTDVEYTINGQSIAVVFKESKTLILHATTSNGSKAQIRIVVNKVKTDNTKPVITTQIQGTEKENTRTIVATITDTLPTAFVTDQDNISTHTEGSKIKEQVESAVSTKEMAGITTMTKTLSFKASEVGTYTIYAYDMAGNFEKAEVKVDFDSIAPTLTKVTQIPTKRAASVKVEYTLNEVGTVQCANQIYNVAKAGDKVTFNIKKNGIYKVVGKDVAGNITEDSFEVSCIDSIAPVITQTVDRKFMFEVGMVTTEQQIKDELLKYFIAVDDSNEACTISVALNENIDLNNKGNYVATIKAVDPYQNTSKTTVIVWMTKNVVQDYPELSTFSVNGKYLIEGSIVRSNSMTLKFGAVPDNAQTYYAKGQLTGAQMKYSAKLFDESELIVDKAGYYTIMIRMPDESRHIYYVYVMKEGE